MSADRQRDRVDQILFWWTPDNAYGRGVGPVRTSVETDQRSAAYVDGLSDFVRMSDGATRRPPWSLTYVRSNAWAAAIRRTRVGDDNRHDIGHALVGHPDKITPSLALALSEWPDWRVGHDLDGPVSALSGSHLRQECRRQRPSLDALGPHVAGPASVLLAHRLAQPDAQFGVVTPSDLAPESIVATLWTVHQTLAAVLHDADDFDSRHETFTTYAAGLHDGADHRLRTVCAPSVGSTGSFGVSRQVVHPWQAGGQPPQGMITPADAAILVRLYVRLGRERLRAELEAAGSYRSMNTRSRIRQLPETISRMRDALDGVQREVRPRPSQAVTQPNPHQGGVLALPPVGLTGDDLAVPEPEPVSGPADEPSGAGAPQESLSRPYTTTSGRPLTPVEIIRRVTHVSPGDLEQWLSWNLPAGTDLGPADRSAVRAELVDVGFHAGHLFAHLPGDRARTVLTRLVEVAVGPELATSDPWTWEFLRPSGLPNVVVGTICDYACDRGLSAPLLPWLGLRYLDQAGHHVPPGMPVWLGPPPRRHARLRTWLRVRRTALIRAGWLVNAVTAGVLIGLLLAIVLLRD